MDTVTGTLIERADVMVLSHRLSRTRYFSTGSNVTRDSVVVRIADRRARVGWGETYLVPRVVEAAKTLVADLPDIAAETAAARLAASPAAHRWALAAVSMALDDLRARQRGVPLGELYGPRIRERIAPYASSAGYVEGVPPAEAWTAEARMVRDTGFSHMKLRVGRGPLRDELPAIEAVVRGVSGLDWMADGNGAYGMEDARRLGHALEAMGCVWLEEPLPTSDFPAYAPLARELVIPIAGGEAIETVAAAERALAAEAFDIIQPDASICGGIGPLLAIADRAAAHGVACVPHACNGAISLAATLQVLSVLPMPPGPGLGLGRAEPMLEHDVGENPLRTALLCDTPTVSDGWLAIPGGPGLGVEVDESILGRYLV